MADATSHQSRTLLSVCRRSTLIDRLELLNRQVVGNCSAVVAEGDAAVVAQLAKEVAKQQVRTDTSCI